MPCLLRIKCTEQAGRDGGAVTLRLPRHAWTASHADEGPRVTQGPGDRWGLWGSTGLWGPGAAGGPGVHNGLWGHPPAAPGVTLLRVLGTLIPWGPPSPEDSHYLGTTIPENHHSLGIPVPRVALSPCCPHSEQHRALRAAAPWGPPSLGCCLCSSSAGNHPLGTPLPRKPSSLGDPPLLEAFIPGRPPSPSSPGCRRAACAAQGRGYPRAWGVGGGQAEPPEGPRAKLRGAVRGWGWAAEPL